MRGTAHRATQPQHVFSSSSVVLSRAALSGRTVRVVRAHSQQPHHNPYADPYATLGLQPGASPDEVKAAYRKLAKKLHPDVSKGNTEMQFLNISDAYGVLMAHLARGGDSTNPDGTPKPANSAAFHDWYWSFRMSRTWAAQRKNDGQATSGPNVAGAPQSPGAPVQSQEQLKSQLAGLRHRAAIRRNRPSPAAASHSDSEASQDEHSEPVDRLHMAQQCCVAAEGPSDSSDVPMGMHTVHTAASVQGAAVRGQDYATPPPEHDPHTPHAPPRKFVANSNVREGIKSQLHGMRRKATLRQEMHSSA